MTIQMLPPQTATNQKDQSSATNQRLNETPTGNRKTWRTHAVRAMIALPILLIVGGLIWWSDGGKYRFIPKRFGIVEHGKIYRSGQMSKWVVEDTLREHKIGSVVHLACHDINDEHLQAELAAAKRLGIIVYRYPLGGDGTGPPAKIAEAVHRIHQERQAGKRVLVHCHAGSNRTGVVLGYYRLLVQRHSPDAIMAEMLRYDFDPEKSPETLPFFNANAQAVANLLFEKGVLPEPVTEIPELSL